MAVDEFAQFEGQGVFQAVEDALAVLFAGEDAGAGEQGKVFGDIGLRRTGRGHDAGDGARPAADGLENPEAHGLAQELEMLRDAGQFRIAQQPGIFFI